MSLTFTHNHVWRIAFPLMVSNITIPLLGLVDAFVVGHLENETYLSAIAIGATIFSFLFLGFNFLRMGTTGFAAQAWGEQNHQALSNILARSVIIAMIIALLIMMLQKPIINISLLLLGPDAVVSKIASDYFSIRVFAAPASLINIVLIGWFIGLQNARIPLLLMLTINLCNILLDLLFVLYFDFKANGVAWASLIAEYLGLLVGLGLALRQLTPNHLNFSGLWQRSKFKALMTVNFDLLIRSLALQFAFAFVTSMGARQGSAILAANAILLNFQSLMAYLLDGFANAAEALVGRAVGAKDSQALHQAVTLCRQWSLVIAVVATVLFLLLGRPLIFTLTDLDHIRRLAIEYLPWLIISPLISVWSFLYDGVFVGAVLSRQMRNIMLVSTFVVLIPTWWLLQPLQNHGLWLAFLCFMAARGILMHFSWNNFKTDF